MDLGDDVVGVTFECDTPAQARERTIVSTTAIPEGLSAHDIDAFVSQCGPHATAPLVATYEADVSRA